MLVFSTNEFCVVVIIGELLTPVLLVENTNNGENTYLQLSPEDRYNIEVIFPLIYIPLKQNFKTIEDDINDERSLLLSFLGEFVRKLIPYENSYEKFDILTEYESYQKLKTQNIAILFEIDSVIAPN